MCDSKKEYVSGTQLVQNGRLVLRPRRRRRWRRRSDDDNIGVPRRGHLLRRAETGCKFSAVFEGCKILYPESRIAVRHRPRRLQSHRPRRSLCAYITMRIKEHSRAARVNDRNCMGMGTTGLGYDAATRRLKSCPIGEHFMHTAPQPIAHLMLIDRGLLQSLFGQTSVLHHSS